MYVRAKEVAGRIYYQAVQGYRDATGRVRHRTLASLGQHPTVAEALKATEREARQLRRDLDRERGSWPDATRPRRSAARLRVLERRLAQAEERRRRLKGLLGDVAVVDTTPVDTTPRAIPEKRTTRSKQGGGGAPRPRSRSPAALHAGSPDELFGRQARSSKLIEILERIDRFAWTPEEAVEQFDDRMVESLLRYWAPAEQWLVEFRRCWDASPRRSGRDGTL